MNITCSDAFDFSNALQSTSDWLMDSCVLFIDFNVNQNFHLYRFDWSFAFPCYYRLVSLHRNTLQLGHKFIFIPSVIYLIQINFYILAMDNLFRLLPYVYVRSQHKKVHALRVLRLKGNWIYVQVEIWILGHIAAAKLLRFLA